MLYILPMKLITFELIFTTLINKNKRHNFHILDFFLSLNEDRIFTPDSYVELSVLNLRTLSNENMCE